MRTRIAVVLLVLLTVLGSQAGRFLVVDRPQPSDAIVVLAGETTLRPARGLELLRQGMGQRVFLDVQSREVVFDQTLMEIAQRYINAQAERERMVVCSISALSTYSEAEGVNRCLRPYGVRTVLIVSSASHSRRALHIFRHRLPQYQFTVAAAQDPTHFGVAWWTNREWAKTTLDEWLKLTWWVMVDRWR